MFVSSEGSATLYIMLWTEVACVALARHGENSGGSRPLDIKPEECVDSVSGFSLCT